MFHLKKLGWPSIYNKMRGLLSLPVVIQSKYSLFNILASRSGTGIFKKSVNVGSVLVHAQGYCEELLSNQLQGGAIKEALKIHLLVKYRAEFPTSTMPDWFPPELVSAKQEALDERRSPLLGRDSTMPH